MLCADGVVRCECARAGAVAVVPRVLAVVKCCWAFKNKR